VAFQGLVHGPVSFFHLACYNSQRTGPHTLYLFGDRHVKRSVKRPEATEWSQLMLRLLRLTPPCGSTAFFVEDNDVLDHSLRIDCFMNDAIAALYDEPHVPTNVSVIHADTRTHEGPEHTLMQLASFAFDCKSADEFAAYQRTARSIGASGHYVSRFAWSRTLHHSLPLEHRKFLSRSMNDTLCSEEALRVYAEADYTLYRLREATSLTHWRRIAHRNKWRVSHNPLCALIPLIHVVMEIFVLAQILLTPVDNACVLMGNIHIKQFAHYLTHCGYTLCHQATPLYTQHIELPPLSLQCSHTTSRD